MGRSKKTNVSRPDDSERVMVTRRLPRALWERVQAHADSIEPRTTDTAIMELALREYLDRNEPK